MNSLWNIAWGLSNRFQEVWNKLENISKVFKKIPDILVYTVSWKKLKKIPKINSHNFKLYIWQIFNNSLGLYDEDFIIWSIKSYLSMLDEWEKLVIESSSIVSWTVNNIREKDWALSPQDQITYLNEIVEKYFPEQKDKILINRLEDTNSDLLSEIEKNWLVSLESDNQLKLDKNTSSLDLAKILYKATCENNDFFVKIASTAWKKRQKWEKFDKANLENYYAIVEIAIRLKDYINGVNIHWWESRQREYDEIIFNILNWNYDHIQELKKLKEFCLSIQKTPFSSLTFSKDRYKKELERQLQKKDFLRKVRNIIWVTSLAVWAIVWTWVWTLDWYKQKQEQGLDKKIETILLHSLKDKTIYTFLKPWFWTIEYKTDESKKLLLDMTWTKLAKYFIQRYWNWNSNISEKELKLFFILEMIEFKQFPHYDDYEWEKPYIKFIEKVLQNPRAKAELILKWFNVDKDYFKFTSYKDAFERTYKNTWDFELNRDFINSLSETYVDSKWNYHDIKKIRCYTIPSMWDINCPIWLSPWNEYMLSRDSTYSNYSLEKWKEVALDFLSTPFNELVLEIMTKWYIFSDDMHSQEKNIRKKLVNLVLEKKFTLEEIKSRWVKEIIAFLQNNFKDILIIDFKQICEDTINLDDELIKKFNENKDNLFVDKIWEIKMWTFDYSVTILEFNWKKYFYLDSSVIYDHWESLRLYWYLTLEESKNFSKELQKLL